jgi:hypothetical protein
MDFSKNTGLCDVRIHGIRFLDSDPDWLAPTLRRLHAPKLHVLELGSCTPIFREDELEPLADFTLENIDWESVDQALRMGAPNLETLRMPVSLLLEHEEDRPMSYSELQQKLEDKLPLMKSILVVSGEDADCN